MAGRTPAPTPVPGEATPAAARGFAERLRARVARQRDGGGALSKGFSRILSKVSGRPGRLAPSTSSQAVAVARRPFVRRVNDWLDDLVNPHRATTLLMRVLSLFYIALTVELWRGLVGLTGPSFADMAVTEQAVTVVFAIMHPAVAVALWMAAPWGLALWMMAAAVRAVVDLALYDRPILHPDIVALAVVVAGFAVLTAWRLRWDARHPGSLDTELY